MDFAALLAPITVEQFSISHWRRSPLALLGEPDRLTPLGFDPERMKAELRRRAPATVLRARFVDSFKNPRTMSIGIKQIEPCLETGMVIDITNVGTVVPGLSAASRVLASSAGLVSGCLQWNCHIAPPGSALGWRRQENGGFMCVVEGGEVWSYAPTKPSSDEVPGGASEELPSLDEEARATFAAERVSLARGDALYLPPGTWVESAATASGCVTLELCVTKGHARELLERCLQEWVRRNDEGLRPLSPGASRRREGGGIPLAVEAPLAELLASFKQFAQSISIEAFGRAWSECTESPPDGSGEPRP